MALNWPPNKTNEPAKGIRAEQITALRKLLHQIRTECKTIIAKTDVRNPASADLHQMIETGLLSPDIEKAILTQTRERLT